MTSELGSEHRVVLEVEKAGRAFQAVGQTGKKP